MNETNLDLGEKIVRYIFSRLGCVHPFRISRLILLAEWLYNDRYESKLSTGFTYVAKAFGFYVEELPKIVDKLDKFGCIVKVKEKKNKCFLYKCDVPTLDNSVSEVVDTVLNRFGSLSDKELNNAVVKDDRYKMLLNR